MRLSRSLALTLGSLLLASFGLAACGSEDEPGDKRLTVYSGRSENLVGPILQEFQEESGITVEVRYG
ncbi:MAG TPA: iron ABC transporter substrate-binding protein, partial [Micromonosporaceae bacterium]|nr:iron ABC transporter substrate-binding protein [Micromonosporaceae bacterium]